MRKLIAVGVLVGGLLAGAGSAMAQPLPNQGGIGDPLTLAASGVLLPFVDGTPGGTVSLLQVASPVGQNLNMHMLFYDNTCSRIDHSVPIPETVHDIAFFDPSTSVGHGVSGLVAIAGANADGSFLVPLTNPIHTRTWVFNANDGRSRYFEPIILDTAEFGVAFSGDGRNTWSPLRTGATFYASPQTPTVQTYLTLICPRPSIQTRTPTPPGPTPAFGSGPGPFSNTGFPVIDPPFQVKIVDEIFVRIYNANEIFVRDARTTCDCIVPDYPIINIDSVYGNPALPPTGIGGGVGSYSELEINGLSNNGLPGALQGSFTGYTDNFTLGSGPNHFWGRLSNNNRISDESIPIIGQGTVTNKR